MNSPDEIISFEELVRLHRVSEDTFTAVSPKYVWGRVYGGQVVAQALNAAIQTVDIDYRVHSVHAYFIRGGTSEESIEYEVDRIRNGRSFITRRVVAKQTSGAILNLAASFQITESGPDIQKCSIPDSIPPPEELQSDNWTPIMERKVIPDGILENGHGVWIRLNGNMPENDRIAELGLTYTSDDAPFDAAVRLHPKFTGTWDTDNPPTFFSASLDHAVWFHQTTNPYEWHFHHHIGLAHMGNRGLATGAIYSIDGKYIATVTQEILQRL